jgi:serine/threonine protein kinase/tetratricopeptide (TPR) repeat protein
MTDKFNREKQIFEQALDLDSAEERQSFLQAACGDDVALRQRLEALLQAHDRAEGFLDSAGAPPDLGRTVQLNLPPTEKPGDRIGRYKLLQQIGEGGCGVVYMAEQEEPVRRRVALKVIKLGMDTKSVIARFEAERQALALMDHPNISKVLDAGATETGRPYFVMELVRGIKITDFCDENNVPTQDRLKLFIQVCQAIQHAHQKGIIHRDIKPSNILVTINDGAPVPKVIDFGIAKATAGRLTDRTLFTAFDQFIGTPAYMSPEQAVMTSLDIDTRSDIYSLGVLLYELLVGCTPFDQKELLAAGLDEMRRTIREKEPPKPSTRLVTMMDGELTTTAKHRRTEAPKLIHVVRGDLDWIVMKCLEKERGRRYETANGVAADIQRHLNNEPVIARPPSKLYEFQKTVRRHKFGFAAATALILALTLGVVGSTWQAIRATHAEREQVRLRLEAEVEKKRSEQVAKFMTSMLEGAGPKVARGRDATLLREILEQTGARIEAELTNQPEVQGDLWMVLGDTYEEIGHPTNAIIMYEQAVKNYRRAFDGEHVKLAIALGELGSVQGFINLTSEGTNNAWVGLQMARHLGDEKAVASALMRYAYSLRAWGQGARAAEPYLLEALAIRQKFGTNDELMSVYNRLALLGTNASQNEALTRLVLNYRLQKHGEDDVRVASARYALGQHLLDLERPSEAEVEFRKAMLAWRAYFPPEHPHRHILFRFFIQSLALQKKYQDIAAAISQEKLDCPTNSYCATTEMALKVTLGEWSHVPTNVLLELESKINQRQISYNAAIALARTGQMEDYRRCCAALLKRTEGSQDFTRAEQAAKAALFLPSDPVTIAAAGRLADFAATAESPEFLSWAFSTKALAEYRRGNFSSAISFADRALAGKDVWRACEATAYCIQALAYLSLGDESKARTALNSVDLAEAKYRDEIIHYHWHMGEYWGMRDWITCEFLKREAVQQLNSTTNAANSEN